MANKFNDLLPTPSDNDVKANNPEYAMRELSDDLLSKYRDRIVGVFASTSEITSSQRTILNYTYYLIFPRHDNFSYPLFTAKCVDGNGSYPIEVMSHYGPPIAHGKLKNYDEFTLAISDILKEDRTRNIILSMY